MSRYLCFIAIVRSLCPLVWRRAPPPWSGRRSASPAAVWAAHMTHETVVELLFLVSTYDGLNYPMQNFYLLCIMYLYHFVIIDFFYNTCIFIMSLSFIFFVHNPCDLLSSWNVFIFLVVRLLRDNIFNALFKQGRETITVFRSLTFETNDCFIYWL